MGIKIHMAHSELPAFGGTIEFLIIGNAIDSSAHYLWALRDLAALKCFRSSFSGRNISLRLTEVGIGRFTCTRIHASSLCTK